MAPQKSAPKPAPKPRPRVEAEDWDDEPDDASPPEHGDAPAPVKTAADEQRERSDEMMHEGFQHWKDKQDERPPEERVNKQVPGVATPKPEKAK